MKYREITKLVEQDGWYWKRTTGSHRVYKHPTKTGTVVITYQVQERFLKERGRVF